MALQILTTKLHAPGIPSTYIPRLRLEALLDRGAQGRLTLVAAPAGFGKSSLLAAWAQKQASTAIAWLHLDAADNDPYRFLVYLISALAVHHAPLGDLLPAMDSVPPAPTEALLTALINEIASFERPVILILDDYHLIETPAVHDAVSFVLAHMPAMLHLILSTRADPPLPLHRLRAQGELVELRSEQLRFDRGESGRYLTDVTGENLTEDELSILQERVEGWVAGLQMLALSLQGVADIHEFIVGFSGSHRYIMDYLTEEVFNQQDPDIQHFLMHTSILERLCGPLCDFALEDRSEQPSQEVIEYLDQANLFLIPLDAERSWYRYHHLFAELLRQRLRQSAPGCIPKLLLRAALWFETNGYLEEAFDHALAAGDPQAAGEIVERCTYAMLRRGQLAVPMRWLHQLSDDVIKARPCLSVACAWVLILTAARADVEEYLTPAELDPDDPHGLAGEVAAIRAYAAGMRQEYPDSLSYAEQALARLPTEDESTRSVVEFVRGGVLSMKGELEAAVTTLDAAALHGERSGNLHAAVGALNTRAGVEQALGRHAEAENTYHKALKLGRDAHDRPLPITAGIHANLARLALARHDLQAAREYARIGQELGERWVIPDSQINALLLQAEIAHMERNEGEVHRAMEQVSYIADASALTPGTLELIQQVRETLESGKPDYSAFGGLAEPLSAREIEVLRLMAEGRSNPEIAEALIVALGTVKAHSSSIYRKLDVTNRTQAVVRARELGLL